MEPLTNLIMKKSSKDKTSAFTAHASAFLGKCCQADSERQVKEGVVQSLCSKEECGKTAEQEGELEAGGRGSGLKHRSPNVQPKKVRDQTLLGFSEDLGQWVKVRKASKERSNTQPGFVRDYREYEQLSGWGRRLLRQGPYQ